MKMIAFILAASCLCTGCSPLPSHGSVPSEQTAEISTFASSEEASLEEQLDYFLNDGMSLPAQDESGNVIEWSVASGHAEITENTLKKTEDAEEYESIVLKAEIPALDESYELERLLLDTYSAYVISYFTSEGSDPETLKLAYTFDCKYWFKINNDNPILKPSKGTKRLRDPSLVRKKDGSFALLATQGYDTDSIYVYDTENLGQYTNERLLKLNASSEEQMMSEKQAWAPEGFYDWMRDAYVLIWSSKEDGGMYFSTSSDLTAVSYPSVLMSPGYPVIDGTLVRDGSEWVMIYKDESEPMEDHSQLFRAVSSDGWENLGTFDGPIYDRHQVEGPMIMKALNGEGWYVVCDDYTRGAYKVLFTEDIAHGTFEEVDDADLMIPLEAPAHGSAIAITWNELQRLLEVYPDALNNQEDGQ